MCERLGEVRVARFWNCCLRSTFVQILYDVHLGRRQRRASMLWGHRDRQVALPFEKLVFPVFFSIQISSRPSSSLVCPLYFRQREAVQRKNTSHGLRSRYCSPRTKTRIVAKQLTVSCAWSRSSRAEVSMSILCCRGAFGRRVKLAPRSLVLFSYFSCCLPFLQAIATTCDEQRVEWKKEYFGAW